MNTKNNKKSLYTKNQLTTTLLKMLDEFSYEQITILQVCQYANIARASFYRNFSSKDEILEFHINDIIDKAIPDKNDEARMFLKSSESIAVWFNQKDLLNKLYRNNLFYLYTNQLNKVINEAFKLKNPDEDDPFYDYMATEMAYIISSIFYKWTERGFKEGKKEMSELLERLHSSRAARELLPKKG